MYDMSIITKALKKAQDTRMGLSATRVHLSPSVSVKGKSRRRPPKPSRIELIGNGKGRSAAAPHRFLSVCILLSTILGSLTAILLYINRSSAPPLPVSSGTERTIFDSARQEDIKTDIQKETEDIPGETSAEKDTPEKTAGDFSENLPVLNGIMYSPVSPQAVINGRMVAEGEAIAGFSILNILPDRVKIASGNEEFDLKIR